MFRYLISLFFILLFACSAGAYIPKSNTIFARTATNHGNGLYKIVQEVQFPMEGQTFALKETWYIDGTNKLYVEVTGTKEWKDEIRFTLLYKQGQRYAFKTKKSTTKTDIPSLFLPNYFHSRNPEELLRRFVTYGVIPNHFFTPPEKPVHLSEIKHEPETDVRLSRIGGIITYALGKKSEAENITPGLWIEQDKFIIRKIRFPEKIEVRAENYSQFPRNLWLAKTKKILWEDQEIKIHLISCRAIRSSKRVEKKFKGQELEGLLHQSFSASLPIKEMIQDFYSRFR